eukprot:symbB.v1.2.003347.t2/scaffold172.1/size290804/13
MSPYIWKSDGQPEASQAGTFPNGQEKDPRIAEVDELKKKLAEAQARHVSATTLAQEQRQEIEKLHLARTLEALGTLLLEVQQLKDKVAELQEQRTAPDAAEQTETERLRDAEAHAQEQVQMLQQKLSEVQAQHASAAALAEQQKQEMERQREQLSEACAAGVQQLKDKVSELQEQRTAPDAAEQTETERLRDAEAHAQEQVQMLQQKLSEVEAQHASAAALAEQQKQEMERQREQLSEVQQLKDKVSELQVSGSSRAPKVKNFIVRRMDKEANREMETFLPLLWSRWKTFWLEKKRAQYAGLEAKAAWAKEEYAKEISVTCELRRALAEALAGRQAAEKQQQQLQKDMKELLQRDVTLNTKLEKQEHSFKLEIKQLRTEVDRRPFSARSRSKSNPREDLIASPQSDAVLAEDARLTAAGVVHSFLHGSVQRPRWPFAGDHRSSPVQERSPVRKAIPIDVLKGSPGDRRLKPPLPRPRIEPSSVCLDVDVHPGEAWLSHFDRGLPLEESFSDALTVQDDGSEASCAGDRTSALIQMELREALDTALHGSDGAKPGT